MRYKDMFRFRKTLLAVLAIVLVLALVLSGCFGSKKIGKKAALANALGDAGVASDQIRDVDVELERGINSTWYEVSFESGFTEYEYKIDAFTGEVLSSRTD